MADYTSYSVSELFQTLTIPEIQTISSTYKTASDDAKNQLQSLVSENYRDIIGITDEINDTYLLTQTLSKKLSTLSYSTPNFVSFKKNLVTAKPWDNLSIANLIIHNELTEFDLKLRAPGSLPINTSEFIDYAKLYYIIDTSIEEIRANHLLFSKFNRMKLKFIEVLNDLISTYNVPINSVYTPNSDKFIPSHHLYLKDLISSQPVDSLNESDLEFLDIDSSLSGDLPIINYLLSYIIVTGTTTKTPIIYHFLDLRVNHLNKVISFLKVKNAGTYFLPWKIIKFVENTINYISIFDTFHKFKIPLDLKKRTFGKFNLDAFNKNKNDTLSDELKQYKSQMLTQINEIFKHLIANKDLKDIITIFINFMSSLYKLGQWCNDNGFKSSIESDANHVSNTITIETVQQCELKFPPHLNKLDTILNNLRTAISLDLSIIDDSKKLFTADLVDLIHNDMNNYFEVITEASKSSFVTVDLVSEMHQWFDVIDEFNSIIDINGKQLVRLIEFLNVVNFEKLKVQDEFKKLSDLVHDKINDKLTNFINSLNEIIQQAKQSGNMNSIYYIVTILIILNQKAPTLEHQIVHIVEPCYDLIFKTIDNNDLDDQLEAIFTSIANNDSDIEIDSVQVSLKLTTLLYSLSNKIINPLDDRHLDYIYGVMFSDEKFIEYYKASKNKWLNNLLTKIYNIIGNLEINKSGYFKIFANICFICKFSNTAPNISKVIGEGTEVNEINLKEVELSIKEVYNNCSNTYYPLNI